MDAHGECRGTRRFPAFRILHAHALNAALQRLVPSRRRQASRLIATAAIEAIRSAGFADEILCLAFRVGLVPLVLSARPSAERATTTIEVDLRPRRLTLPTLAGPMPKPRAGERRRATA